MQQVAAEGQKKSNIVYVVRAIKRIGVSHQNEWSEIYYYRWVRGDDNNRKGMCIARDCTVVT